MDVLCEGRVNLGWGHGQRPPGGLGVDGRCCCPMSATLSLPPRAQECLDKFTTSLSHKLDSHAVREQSRWDRCPASVAWASPVNFCFSSGAFRCHPAHAAAADPNPSQRVSRERNQASILLPVPTGASLGLSAGSRGSYWVVFPLLHRGLRGFREARRDFWKGAESLEAALIHNAEVPRRRAQEAEEAGAALKTARAGYQGRALDYALQVPTPTHPASGSEGLWPLRGWRGPPVQWEGVLWLQD